MLRWPSLRRPLDVLFLLACVALTAEVLVPEIWGHGKSKDYGLWYWAGQQVLHGGPLYESAHGALDFIYPPTGAILLALPSALGKVPLYLLLCLLNSAAWWLTGQLSNALTGEDKPLSPWLAALPALVTITFVFDMYDLGQPNLVLLVMMLAGFWWLQRGRPWLAGSAFALATAIKVFPASVFAYLLYRRYWKTAVSMVVFLVLFLFVLPAPIRGFDRNIAELKTWYGDMVGSASESGFGQRNAQNWSWVNQSIIAQTHRFARPVNYEQLDASKPPAFVNVADVNYRTANWLVLAVCGVLGLGFLVVTPAKNKMTPRSTAEEIGILFCLMTIASPLARQYYFLWLFFPLTVLFHRASFDPRICVRRATWASLAAAGALMLLSLPVFPHLLQALGNNLAATAVIVAALAWRMRHPPVADAPISVQPS